MENMDTVITLNTLQEIGFVPSILIVGGWFYAGILALACIYNLGLYIVKLLIGR